MKRDTGDCFCSVGILRHFNAAVYLESVSLFLSLSACLSLHVYEIWGVGEEIRGQCYSLIASPAYFFGTESLSILRAHLLYWIICPTSPSDHLVFVSSVLEL